MGGGFKFGTPTIVVLKKRVTYCAGRQGIELSLSGPKMFLKVEALISQ